MSDDDHLRDDPTLPGGREYDGLGNDAPPARPCPTCGGLGMFQPCPTCRTQRFDKETTP